MAEGRIHTPRDLDAAGKALDALMHAKRSPQLQLHALTDFFSDTAHLPIAWTRTYLLPLSHPLIRLILHPYTVGHHPHLWISAMDFLGALEGEVSDAAGLLEARGEALLKGCLSHGYVADLRGLYGFLQKNGTPMPDIDERKWRRIYGSGPAPLAMFEAFCEALGEDLAKNHPLLLARHRWRTAQARQDAVAVVLLETDQDQTAAAGAVLQMEIASRRSSSGGIHINNVLGADADLTRRQLQGANDMATAFTQQHTGFRFDRREVFFQFIDLHAAFSGGSLGLAATVGLACHLSRQVNARIRWTLPTDTACVASLDDHGQLESAAWDTLRRKLELAFYSPLRRVVIPETFVEEATRYVQQLQKEYPQRWFEVYSAAHFSDCFRPDHVVETLIRNPYDRVQMFTQRYARALSLLVAFLVLVVAAGLFYRSFVAFPDLEVMRGITVGESAIVFNPHDSVEWAFRDGRLLRPPRISFGDLEVGDGFSRTVSVYNMTPRDREVYISIEGPNNSDWYVSSGAGATVLKSTIPSEVTVMYAPVSSASRKEAALVIRDEAGGEEYFRLKLDGCAGRAMPGGYALRLSEGPDFMTWGTNSLAFTSGELTLESWVRSLNWDGCFLHNGLNSDMNPGMGTMTISFSEGRPQIFLGNERFTVPLPSPMKPNQWHHVALAYSISRHLIRFFLDGKAVFERRAALAMPSRSTPYVSLGAYADSNRVSGYLACEIDNFRVWWSVLKEAEIRARMNVTLPGTSPALQASFDMETNCDMTAFNGSNASQDAELRYRPVQVRSTAPILPASSLPRLIPGPRGLPAIALPPGAYLYCARQLLPRKSDACFAFWWYTDVRRSTAFVYENLDHYISFSSDTIATSYSGCASDIIGSVAPGWHHITIRVLHTGVKEVFIDGRQRGALTPCHTPGGEYYDWHYRYEGMTFGLFNDKYNMFSAKLHAVMREALAQTRRIADIAIWRRLLCDEEIARLAEGADPPPDHLVAYWHMDQAPNAELNFIDRMEGHLLHIKSAPAYR
ncbi:MAG: LamG domain-containing protein [Bacteroidetes bacterium]|nr:LamG domain-containing protein [Bacteroidota bacterium]